MRKRSAIGRLGRLGFLVVVALVLSLPVSGVSRAATFTFQVQSEQAITGTTTGLGGAQTDDGVHETLYESDTASDPLTAPATQTLTTGTMVGGTFPGDVAADDGVLVQYRESMDSVEAEIGYRSNTGTNTESSPKNRTWDGSTWSGEAEKATAGGPIRAVRIAWSPTTSATRIIVTQSDDGWLDAYVCTPTCTVTNNIGQVWSVAPASPEKRFDIAYEQMSGEALLVFGVLSTDTTRDIAYRTYVGGTWSAEQYLDDAGHATDIQYSSINVASRKGTDQIGVVGGDITNDDVNAWIWDGSAWANFAEITATAETPNQERIAIAWESGSGHVLAVTVPAGSVNIIFREYTAGWGPASTFQCANDNSEYLSLKSNPSATANDMVLALNDDVGAALNLYTCYWNGSSWANWNTHDTEIDSSSTRPFDFAWENSGNRGLLVWGTTAGQVAYKTFTAPNTWGAQTNVAMGSGTHPWVQLRTNPRAGSVKILGAVLAATQDLGAIKWDGTSFTVVGASTFSADVGSTLYESFELEYKEIDVVEAKIAYRSNTGTNTLNSPKTRTWDGSTWSGESEQSTASSPIRGVRMAWSPTSSTTRITVTQSDDGWLDAYVCTPSCTVTNNIGQVWSTAPTTSEMRFDVAYEYLTGDALLVYGVLSADTTRDIAIRTYVSGSWGAEQYLDDAGHGTDVQYSLIKLASRRGSDQIGLIGGDDTNNDVNAWIWDGSAWGNFAEITATAQSPNREEVAIAWESNSGHLLAVAALVSDIVSREYTTSWDSAVTFMFVENNLQRLSLKPNPAGDDMIIVMGEDGDQLETNYWTGSAWANNVVHDADPLGTGRAFDFAWEATGSKGLLVWSDTAGQISYRTFTAPNTWGSQADVAMGANAHPWVQLRTNPSAGAGATKILGAVMETTANDLGAIRWDGTTFTVIGPNTFSADVGANTENESFELEYPAVRDDQLLFRYDWTGVPAGDSYTLHVKGYRQDEDINVQVLTPPSTWTTRITVNSLTNQLFTAGMTLSEYNGGSPQVRFVDTLRQDGSVSDLFLDWVGVTAVRLTYSLEVRHNITGIIAGSNPILVVKGNITAGGENFHVHVWNFVSSSWDLLMAAPFTGTNAYNNASLAADHLSGGNVRIRFVDAASLDLTRWALSLDFVAVVITNDQPTLADAGVSPASGYITTSFTFFVRYSDPENNAPAFVNLTLDGIVYAMVENNSADTNYVDGKDYFLNRVIGVRGTFNFSFSARASAGDLTVAATPVRQVSVVNRAPTISNPIASDGVHTGRSYMRDFNGTDPDNDTLAWSLSTNAPWLAVGSGNGTVWGAAPGAVGVFYVEVGVGDGFGGSASNNYTLSVGNLAPSISNPLTTDGIHSGRSYVRGFTGIDPDGDSLLWSVSTNAPWVAIGSANGTVWGVAPSTVGVFYVNIQVSDGFGGSASNNYTLSVGNLAPSISNPIGSAVSLRQASFVVDFNAVDSDGDALTWSLQTNAGFLSVNVADGTVTGLTWNAPATYWVEVTVSDGFGGTDRLNFSLIVVNRPPQAIVTASETGRENELYEASFSATDPDSDPVGWSLATNATWLTLDPGNAKVTGIALPGVYYVNLTASDPFGGVAFRNFTVRIAAAPIIPNEPDGLGGELFLLIVIAAALGVLIGAVLLPRRRQLVDQAFLIDPNDEIRFHYSTAGAPFDEARLWSHLRGQPWREMTSLAARPYTLHVVRREGLHWVIVSRSSDASRVIKAAEKLFMAAQMDLEVIGAQIPAPEVNTGET
ncbi:MAG TPA: hypothetical protein VJN63_01745 [Thermoplasmata archaeon]|nr:hypothetical protein [Thermoplasmata archaeon]